MIISAPCPLANGSTSEPSHPNIAAHDPNSLPTVTETPPSLPRASTELVRRSVNQDLQQTLVAEGKARMQAVKLPLPAGWDVDQLSPALAQSILAISTIKFTAYSAEIDGLVSGFLCFQSLLLPVSSHPCPHPEPLIYLVPTIGSARDRHSCPTSSRPSTNMLVRFGHP